MDRQSDGVKRFFVDGWDAAAVGDGYAWLSKFASENLLSSATIFIEQVSSIPQLHDGLGGARAVKLHRDRRLREDQIAVEVYTSRSHGHGPGPVLGVWVDDKDLLDRLDRWRVPAICAIPWGDSITDWKARWRPTDIRTGEPVPDPGQAVSNPVVVKGLETLTQLANLSNGVDTYNRDTAAQVFRSLDREGEELDPDEVRAWCARNGWGAANAAELADLARSVAAGKRVRTGAWRLRDDIVDRWREDARQDGER